MPTFETPEPIFASLNLNGGSLRINAGDRADTVVELKASDPFSDEDVKAAEQTEVGFANGQLWVRVPRNSRARWLFGWGGSVDVTLDLPSGSRIDVDASAEIRCIGRLGDAKVRTADGDIQLEHAGRAQLTTGDGDVIVDSAAGHAEVTTANGDVRVRMIDGPASITTSNGDIMIGEVAGDLRLNTAHGEIAIDRALAGVVAKTAHGSVRVGEVVRGRVELGTYSGDVELGVRPGTAAWLDVNSDYGTVHIALAAAEGPAEAEETVEVRARTSDGDIMVRRS